MKIGIDARFYGSLGKGLGRYTQKLISYLEQIDDSNEYVVFLRKENFDEYHPSNPRFKKVLADYRWYSFDEQLRFPMMLRKYRFGLMHFPHFNVPLLYRGKFVVTIHDLILLHFPTRRASTLHPIWYALKFLAYRLTIWQATRRSEAILTVSEYTKQDLLEHYRLDAEKVIVTYEAAESFCYSHTRKQSEELLRRFGLVAYEGNTTLNNEKRGIIQPYLLYVGNAYPHKNLEALIVAAHDLEADGVKLVLVGKEDYFYHRLKRLVEEKGMNNVIFAGFVSDEELDVWYRYARAYVFPSLYEGFGLPPLEAMGKGAPVVAAQATSLPEILGDAALYFSPQQEDSLTQALRRIWQDESLRNELRRKGYDRSAGFRWEIMAEETLEAYRIAITKN